MQTNPHREPAMNDMSIKKLQDCLQGELSAEETYELALKSVDHVGLHHTLQEIFASHARRTQWLKERIWRLGGEAPSSSGAWGAVAKAVQAGADLLGDRVAITALEEGEDRALRLYTEDLNGCDARTTAFLTTQLLPEQQRTHQLCRTLKEYVSAPS